jgi:hypothetical protein
MEQNKTIGTAIMSLVEAPESPLTHEPISTPIMSPVESPPPPSTVHDDCDDEWIDFVTFRREALFQNDRHPTSSFDGDENTATDIIKVKTVRQEHLGEDPSSTATNSIQEPEKENPSEKAMLDASDLCSPVSSDEKPSSSFLNNSVLSALSEIEKVDDSIDMIFQTERQTNGYQKKTSSSPSSIMEFFKKRVIKIQDELCTITTICVPKQN